MTPQREALHALTDALLCLRYPTDARATAALRALAQRFLALPPDAPDEEFEAVAEFARDVRFRLELGLDLPD